MPGARAAKPASGAWSWRARRRIQRSQLVFATKPNEARHNQTHSNVEQQRSVYRLASYIRLQAYWHGKMMRVALVGLWWRSGGRRASFQLPPAGSAAAPAAPLPALRDAMMATSNGAGSPSTRSAGAASAAEPGGWRKVLSAAAAEQGHAKPPPTRALPRHGNLTAKSAAALCPAL